MRRGPAEFRKSPSVIRSDGTQTEPRWCLFMFQITGFRAVETYLGDGEEKIGKQINEVLIVSGKEKT